VAFQDYYALFGITPIASENEVRTAYRKLVLQYHPDRNPNNPEAEAKFKEIAEAYRVLTDPKSRAKYGVYYANYQDSLRQQRQAQAAEEKARPAPKPRTAAPLKEIFETPVLSEGDAWWGLALSATLSLLVATGSQPKLWLWCALPVPAAMFGKQFGALWRDSWQSRGDLPGWYDDWIILLPIFFSWVAIAVTLIVARYLQVPLSASGSLAAALGGAVAGFGGGSFARAFLSAADTKFKKAVGYCVGFAVATGVALLLCPIAVLAIHGLFFSTRFYDHLYVATLSGTIGGNLAMLRGATRRS